MNDKYGNNNSSVNNKSGFNWKDLDPFSNNKSSLTNNESKQHNNSSFNNNSKNHYRD